MKSKLLIIAIFLLAFLLRFWQLGNNPSSLDWDEASLGYNAYSILKTGRDEYGNFLPLSIRSFGDYKPPVYTYLTVIPVELFGLNEFSTRAISALFGTLSVIIGYLLVKELFPRKSSSFFLLFSIFFSLSPWHIQFSRVAFEANTALFFLVAGIWLFLKGAKNGKYFLPSMISFGISLYSYHSPRLIVPILILGSCFIYRNEIRKQLKWFIAVLVILVFMAIPILQQMRSTEARFGSVTVLNPLERLGPSINAIEYDQEKGDVLGKLMHNRRIIFARDIVAGYLDHFNFDFLFLTGDPPGRHHAAGTGMLYIWDLPFIILGLLGILGELGKKENKMLVWWFLVAPLASAVTTGTPHAVRALFYLPVYQIFIAIGVIGLIGQIRRKLESWQGRSIIVFVFLLFLANFFYYLHMYYVHTPIEYSKEWQYGYKEVVEEVAKLEPNYNRIIVTYRYDQPYIYFLFYEKIDPVWYQKNWGGGEIKRAERSFGRYEFRNIDWEKDSKLPNTLLVGTPGEIPEKASRIIKQINFLDGTPAFRIVGT